MAPGCPSRGLFPDRAGSCTSSNSSKYNLSDGEGKQDDLWSLASSSQSGSNGKSNHDPQARWTATQLVQNLANTNSTRCDLTASPSGRDAGEAPTQDKPVTWRSLPRRDQLIILALARLSEPLTQTSLQSYMFYQLKSFDPTLPDATISYQAGVLQGAFTATQFLTAIPWGGVADAEWGGRKRVLLIGLLGAAISTFGFGFSKSFAVAVVFRCLGGALNGNIGVMRTMIAEIIKEKKYQSRAFLLLPMTFNIGVIIGPILGGILADPVGAYPGIFGPGSLLGGSAGVSWMAKWPYALPNIVSGLFLLASTLAVVLGLEETLESRRERTDYGLLAGRWLRARILRQQPGYSYVALPQDPSEYDHGDLELQPPPLKRRQKLPFRRVWTRNVRFTLLSHGLLATHVGTFANLWFLFLSAPRFDPHHPDPPSLEEQHPPIHFTGGLGLPPPKIGLALAILGAIGVTLQLALYPVLSTKLGTVRSYRASLSIFPLTYFMAPFLALIPSSAAPPHAASGFGVWFGITALLFFQVLARTFALPGTTILINNCCPHPSVLGTVHGLGQSVSSAARTLGPILGGWAFGLGLRMGVVGLSWWSLSGVAVFGFAACLFVREGSGHEILLEGEEEEGEASSRS